MRWYMQAFVAGTAIVFGCSEKAAAPASPALGEAKAPVAAQIETPEDVTKSALAEGRRLVQGLDLNSMPRRLTAIKNVDGVPVPLDSKGRHLLVKVFQGGMYVVCADGDIFGDGSIYFCIGPDEKFVGFGKELLEASEPPTLAMFNAIRNGMSYDEVVKIVGDPGTVTSSTEMAGSTIETYSWGSPPKVGARGLEAAQLVIVFENRRVYSKSQMGLK